MVLHLFNNDFDSVGVINRHNVLPDRHGGVCCVFIITFILVLVDESVQCSTRPLKDTCGCIVFSHGFNDGLNGTCIRNILAVVNATRNAS